MKDHRAEFAPEVTGDDGTLRLEGEPDVRLDVAERLVVALSLRNDEVGLVEAGAELL